MVWVLATWLIGCGGGDSSLEELDGIWTGSASIDGGATYAIDATLTYTDYLAGEITVQEPGGAMTYAVRRSEVYRGIVSLDCLEASGGLRALDLDGELDDGGAYTGTVTMTYDCGPNVCGYEGSFTLTRGGTPGGTGATLATPGDTGTTPGTTPGDTGATTPGDTGATP